MSPSSDDGERLAKRVAALRGCSRRDAELLIAQGAVRVDGQLASAPQQRVLAHQQVQIDAQARPHSLPPATLIVHKPAGLDCTTGDFWQQLERDPVDAARGRPAVPGLFLGQRCVAPLPAAHSGLVVFTQLPAVARLLADTDAPPEHEFVVEIAGPVAPDALARLRPARASISGQRPEATLLRLVLPATAVPRLDALWAAAGLAPRALRRLRIGRLPLAGLSAGQWRCLRPPERF